MQRHREVARLCALGYSHQAVADMTGYHRRHIIRMVNTEDFVTEVERIKASLSSTLEADILANVSLAVQIERQMLAGDLPSTDKRYIEAKGIVKPIRERLIDVDRGRVEVQE